MARKRTLNRMDYRGDFEEGEGEAKVAADEEETEEEEGEEDEEAEVEGEVDAEEEAADEEEAPKPVKKPKKKAAAAPKRTRAPKVVRTKAVWVVFDNSSRQIETFPFSQKADAEALIEQKNTDKKGAFYLQLLKVPFDTP
jgi:hypothetical protein